ncbi:T9SS type A sorting domain-containing protein [Flavobacterium sp. H122]|uniref:T9SS type A sorting domain-containing protein n=1 Tax=Flavobacterium sp. H122 TaxID=2529860 RepID=UPI0010AADA07|nr:T9SS type A sorting domain-containing protein [Flavobacterium sp. H122]
MKKNVLAFLVIIFSVLGLMGQNYSTGTMTFFGDYSGKIDVNSTTVTVTLVGPSTSWLGIGFDATTMDDTGKDVIIFNGTNISDRSFDGVGTTPPTDTQNWTLSSNTVNSTVRTVVMTRARVATESTDYTFPASAQPLNVIFARRPGSTLIGYHGLGNCGTLTANLSLGTEDFLMDTLKVYPNPSKEFFVFELPEKVTKGEAKIYDSLGKVIMKQEISTLDNKLNVSGLSKGSYMMVLRTEYGNAVKTLIID